MVSPLRLALDVNPTLNAHRKRGIGSYVRFLARGLWRLFRDRRVLFYHGGDVWDEDTVLDASPRLREWHQVARIEPARLIEEFQNEGISLFHVTDYYHPLAAPQTLAGLRDLGVRLVVTVFDAIPLLYPNHYPGEVRVWKENTLPLVACADRIITISENSRQDMMKLLGLPGEKAKAIHLGVDLETFHPYWGEETLQRVRSRYQLPSRYFLFVGASDWRKNLEFLGRVYQRFLSSGGEHGLVVVGAGEDNPLRSLESDQVRVLGEVSQAELPCIYASAGGLFSLPFMRGSASPSWKPWLPEHRSSLPTLLLYPKLRAKSPRCWTHTTKQAGSQPFYAWPKMLTCTKI